MESSDSKIEAWDSLVNIFELPEQNLLAWY